MFFFDKIFDFNGDGKLDAFESYVAYKVINGEEDKEDGADSNIHDDECDDDDIEVVEFDLFENMSDE